MSYQPKTGAACTCKPGVWRDNCPSCEGTGQVIDFAAIRARNAGRREPITIANLYDEAVTQGISIDNHESDLYLKDSEITRTLLRVAHVNATKFVSQLDGCVWWDIPFAFAPFWRARRSS